MTMQSEHSKVGCEPHAQQQSIILSAPSGAGKTSLAHALIARYPESALSVSHTTRPMRPGEQDGVDYYFVRRSIFESMIQAGQFLEYAEVFDNLYGTSRQAVEGGLAGGQHMILDIDWQGARMVREAMADTVSVFILPPSRQALETRLRGRGSDSELVIARRMREAASEASHYAEYDFVIINDNFDASVSELVDILQGNPRSLTAAAPEVEQLVRELSTA